MFAMLGVMLWMGQRNRAPPNGWLKPKQNDEMFTTYQLVIWISLIRWPIPSMGE